MKLSVPLAKDLRLLTRALDEDVAIDDVLGRLRLDARSAVSSYRGLTVSGVGDGHPFSFTVLEDGATPSVIMSSLLAPFPASGGDTTTAITIVLYSAVRGAFVDLAADLAWLSGRDLADFVVDRHLVPPDGEAGTHVAETAIINQALGVLLGRGYGMRTARELLSAPTSAGTGPYNAARVILNGLAGGEPGSETDHTS